MAQTNYTPISLYYSTTASAVPTAANLVPGELAINTNDGKLYYEDSSGVVQVLATKSTGSIGGSNTQVQFNNSGSLGGSSSFTWDGTTVTATKFAGALNGTVGATTPSTGAFTTLSTSSTTTFSGLTASTALALDASKNVVSVTNTGTGNNVLSASPTLTGTIAGASLSLSSLTSGRVTYAGASGLLSDSTGFTFDGTYVNIGTGLASLNGLKFLANAGGLAASLNVNHSSGEIQNYANTNYFQTWYTNNTEKMTITTAGNVGIGTSNPAVKLDVTGLISTSVGATTTNALNINATSAGYGAVVTHQTNGVTKYTAGLNVFTGTGEWGIYDNAAALLRFNITSAGIVSMPVYGAGAATFSAAGVISSVSDETWKTKDGVPVNTDVMLQKLEPGYWFYNEEKAPIFGADRQLGFYAQNVHEAIGEEAAPTPEEGKPWGYYDRSVLAVAVMSLKNALNTIEELKQRITVLENK